MAMNKLLSNVALAKKFDDFLAENGMRRTPERTAIVNHVLAATGHFTIDQLKQQLDEKDFYVSRATLYNTIDLLIQMGVLRRHVFEGLPPQYERANVPVHSHLVCTVCGKVKEVRDNNFIAFMNTRKFTAFTQHYYALSVYGICNTCARKMKRNSKNLKTKQ